MSWEIATLNENSFHKFFSSKMGGQPLRLQVLPGSYVVCRFPPTATPPPWIWQGLQASSTLFSVTRTNEELSVVLSREEWPPESPPPAEQVQIERDWSALKVMGPLDFGLTGILASLAQPLAEAKISIFAVSTCDTDYILVRTTALARALETLITAGHCIVSESS
jgi:uncharacterized protein